MIASKHRAREAEIIERIAATFPRLKQRLDQLGETLSGGEQQMLAIARAIDAEPKMILLDEPSEGIMPILVDEMFRLFEDMKRAGTTILLVEQNVERALSISDRAYIMDQGVIVHTDTAANLLADKIDTGALLRGLAAGVGRQSQKPVRRRFLRRCPACTPCSECCAARA